MSRRIGIILLVSVWLFASIGTAMAEKLEIVIESMNVVADSITGNAVTLLYFDFNEKLTGADIHSAKLMIEPSFDQSARRRIEISVYPLLTEVELSSDALTDDKEPNLDVENGTQVYIDTSTDKPVAVDLTHWLQCLADARCDNAGLCIMSESPLAAGLSLSSDAIQGGIGVLLIEYSHK